MTTELYFEIYHLSEEQSNRVYAQGREMVARLVSSGMTEEAAVTMIQDMFSVGRDEGYEDGHERGYDEAYSLYADRDREF